VLFETTSAISMSFNFCNTPLLQEVQAPGLKFIWKKQFSMFFSLPRLYLTLATIKTSEFSTLGRCILKRVRFRYKNVYDKSFEKTPLSSLLSDCLSQTMRSCNCFPHVSKIPIHEIIIDGSYDAKIRIHEIIIDGSYDTKIPIYTTFGLLIWSLNEWISFQ
jgi:hypothetical protein